MNPNTVPYQPDAGGPAEREQHIENSEAAKTAEHLAGWLPLSARALDPKILAKVEPHARSAVEAAASTTVADVHRMLRASFDISVWTLDELGYLSSETVWHPERARVFVDEVNGHRSVDWRQDARRTLAQVGRAVNPQFWPTATQPLAKTGPADPYSAHGETALQHASLLMGEPGRAEELAVAGFSLGGGINAPNIALAKPSDVIDLGGGRVGIQVRDWVVPIRADYTDLVRRAVEFAGDEPFIKARSRNAAYIAAERVMVHGFGHLELARARST